MADQPKGYVDAAYLDLHKVLLDRAKKTSYELLRLAPGHRVLDVGCGPATDTISLGRLVGPSGEVVGVDYDVEMVDEANRRAAAAGVGAWVKHRQADAAGLPFASNVFDAARSERVFQHLLDPERALAEMARVTRPGGRIVIMDPDWGTLSIDTPETELERRLARFLVDRCVNNAYSGRQLLRQVKRQGLEDVKVRMGHLPLTSYARPRGTRPRSPRATGAGRGGVHPGRARAPAHELRGGGARRVLLRERQRCHRRRTEVRAGLTRRG